MRTLMIIAMLGTTAAPVAAEAQQARGQRATMPAPPMMHPPRPGMPGGQWRHHRPRWGGQVNGRWYAGVYAPGGWAAYRRPVRGWVLPTYWFAPTFYIQDHAGYGLGAPPQGYRWSRYYDDAVLIDERGRVHDHISGIDWDGDDAAYEDEIVEERRVEERVVDRYGAEYPPPREGRRDDGIGGAVIGGAVGAVAGNVIAGRGNRLAGTVIGAGAGAIAGAAIDRAEDRRMRRRPPPPRDYDPRDDGPGHYAPYPPPVTHYDHGARLGYDSRAYAAGAHTTVVHGGYGATTVVTVMPAVTTTTTTTEYVYETVPAIHRPARKRVWRAKAKPRPRQCPCVCKVVCK